MASLLNVVVGIIYNSADNTVLVAKRKQGVAFAGYCEFPGGKIEEGESDDLALRRELYEELGIEITKMSSYMRFRYDYPDYMNIQFHFFLIEEWQGSPYGREQQEVFWEKVASLDVTHFPEASLTVITRVKEQFSSV